MPIFDREPLTPEEQEAEDLAREQVLGMFSFPLTFSDDEGDGTRTTRIFTLGLVLALFILSVAYLTGIAPKEFYQIGAISLFGFGAVNAAFAVYFARKDHLRATTE